MIGLIIWLCSIELAQMILLGRTADVTEPLLLILVGSTFAIVLGTATIRAAGKPPYRIAMILPRLHRR